jgi:antitoxin PrlF
MTKTAEILKILGTITERGQTTVPAAIRKMPALGKRDRSCFAGSPTATVVIAKKEPRADDGDPVIGRCLAFLAHDMAIEPARIRPVPRSMVSRGKALVKGVRVDLNASIRDDK